eukprot:TRINITY_DN16595_c0_g1_i1.p1 TRINITY_DN16595_c0_g1~~TRINITY_DN16595_c0_g1_i1.p1  ORF type:complete len:1239 (+),score=580.13 TRINITY_DN16595_c0_g1_i1:149-3865(+)
MQGEFAMTSRRHVFGLKANVKDNVHYVDDQTVVYPVGKTFVIYNQTTNTQKFTMGQERAEGISAMALTPNKKYVAVGNCGDAPGIEIYDTTTRKRRKILPLSLQDLGSREFACMAFSGDCRHLVAQGAGPDWHLIFWTWDRLKSVAMFPVAQDNLQRGETKSGFVSCVSNNPSDPYHICVTGNGIVRFYRFADGQIKTSPGGMGRRDPQNVLCHRWLKDSDRIVASCESGDILLFENCEFKCVLPMSPGDGFSIDTIVTTSRGFICGGEGGLLHMYEQCDDKELFKKVKSLKVDPRREGDAQGVETQAPIVKSMCLSQQEDHLAIATSLGPNSTYGQLYTLNIGVEGSKAELLQPEYLVAPFHTGPITGIDTCIRKPLIVTCSKDHTIRVWNYLEHTLDIYKSFPVEAMSVAMHPSGLHILVGFADKLRFMNLYGDDIKEFKAFNIRSCPECRFSTGGQYFAAVHGQVIQLYNTYTCEPITQLRGPSGKIRCLNWLPPDDTRLLSAGHDGAIYDWNVREGRKETDNSSAKTVQLTSVASNGSHPSGLLWAVGNDKKLRELELGALSVVNEWEVGDHALLTLVYSMSHKLLIAGVEDGSIKVIATPVQNGIHQAETTTAHGSPVVKVALSFDESVLFSVGEDGALWMFDIKEKDSRATSKREITYTEEILISKADLEEKNTFIGDLKNKVDELNGEMDYLARKREIKHEEKMKELQDQFREDSEKDWSKFEALLSLKQEQEIAFTEIRKETSEKHRKELAKLESEYQTKISEAEDLKAKLQRTLEEQRRQFDDQVSRAEHMLDKTRKELQETFRETLNGERGNCEELRANERELLKGYVEMRAQLEKDTDDEIEEIKDKYEKRLAGERDQYLQLKGENGIMRKKFTHLKKDIKDKTEEIAQLMDVLQMLSHKNTRIDLEIENLKNEIRERDDTIGDKEKRIYELKKRNQELEKYKFVLDFKIRELKSQIEPRQDEIAAAKQRIKDMDCDLEKYHQQNLSLKSSIEELEQKIDLQQRVIHKHTNQLKDADTYRNRIRTDLSELVTKIQEPKQLCQAVAQLYKKHVKSIVSKAPVVDEGLQTEYVRQREYLTRTVESLKKKLVSDSDSHKGEANKIMTENVQLIREINELRKEIRVLKANVSADKNAAKTAALNNALGNTSGSPNSQNPAATQTSNAQEQANRELEMQRSEIDRLKAKVAEAEKELQARRPSSRDLPSLNRPPPGGYAGGFTPTPPAPPGL